RGIGLETVRQLARKGMTVLLGAREEKKAADAAAKLRTEGIEVRPLEIDVSDSASITRAAQKVEREFGKLDILVNNAGIMLDDEKKKASEQSLETWRKTFETNVFGLVETTDVFLPLLKKSEAGRMVTLSG